MPIRNLIEDIRAVTEEEVLQCERDYLNDEVSGELIGCLTDPFILRVVTLLQREHEQWETNYGGVEVNNLTGEEDVRQRIADLRVKTLHTFLDYSLRMQLAGSITFDKWEDYEMICEVRKGWKIWLTPDISTEELEAEMEHAAPAPPSRRQLN